MKNTNLAGLVGASSACALLLLLCACDKMTLMGDKINHHGFNVVGVATNSANAAAIKRIVKQVAEQAKFVDDMTNAVSS